MLTVNLLLVVAAFICALLSAIKGWVPLWVAVLLLCVVALLHEVPLR